MMLRFAGDKNPANFNNSETGDSEKNRMKNTRHLKKYGMIDNIDNQYRIVFLWQEFRKLGVEEIFEFLYDADETTRYTAAKELQFRGGRQVLDKAAELCADSDEMLREVGAFILGQIGTPDRPFDRESIPILMSLFEYDPVPAVRASAAASLGHLRCTEAVSALEKGIHDPDSQVRLDIAGALGNMQDEAALNPLLLLLRDDDNEVRNWAVFGLRMLIYTDHIKGESVYLRNELVKMLNDPFGDVRKEAICALAQLKDDRVLESVEQELYKGEIEFEMIEAAGNLKNKSLLNRLSELKEEWKDDVPSVLIDAISKLSAISDLGDR